MATQKNKKKTLINNRSKKQRGGYTKLQLDAGVDVDALDTPDGKQRTLFNEITKFGGKRKMRKTKKSKRKTRSKRQRGGTINDDLNSASYAGDIEIMKDLLAIEGIDVNAKNTWGNTALLLASMSGQTEPVAMLLTYGADVNMKDINGYTALMWASMQGHTNLVAMLLEQPGIDVNAENDDGLTALHYASDNGHTQIIKLFKQHIVAQTLPNIMKRQRDRKHLAMVMRETPVERKFGKNRIPTVMEHEAMKFLGGKNRKKK